MEETAPRPTTTCDDEIEPLSDRLGNPFDVLGEGTSCIESREWLKENERESGRVESTLLQDIKFG